MRSPKNSAPRTPEEHRSNLVKLLRANAGRHNLWDVFGDFIEMSALAIANKVDYAQFDEREKRYLSIVKRYEPQELARFPQMYAELVNALEYGPDDVLGKVFSELELHNAARGQYFTPYTLCSLIANMNVQDGGDFRARIEQRGFITFNEPACGAGAMVIATAEAMLGAGINYQQHLHVIAQDIDSRAVHMAFIQLSLLHIPAVVILGNTLMLEEREHWYTPAHIMGGWKQQLERGYALGSILDPHRDIAPDQMSSEEPHHEQPLPRELVA